MKILMLKDDKGSRDGINIEEFKAGQTYDLPVSLANSFIILKTAEIIKDKPLENKSVKPRSNKSR